MSPDTGWTTRVRFLAEAGKISSPPPPDRLWVQSSLLPAGYLDFFSGRGVKRITHLHPLPRLRIHGASPSLPHTSNGVELNGAHGQLCLFHYVKDIRGLSDSVYWLGYRLDDRGLIPGRDRDFFLFATAS